MTERIGWADPIVDLIEDAKTDGLLVDGADVLWSTDAIEPESRDGEMSVEDQNPNLFGAAEAELRWTTMSERDMDLIIAHANTYDIEKGIRYIKWAIGKWNEHRGDKEI